MSHSLSHTLPHFSEDGANGQDGEDTFKLEQKAVPQDVFGSLVSEGNKRKDTAEKKEFVGAAERFKRAKTNKE